MPAILFYASSFIELGCMKQYMSFIFISCVQAPHSSADPPPWRSVFERGGQVAEQLSSPVAEIFNASIQEKVVTVSWKEADV